MPRLALCLMLVFGVAACAPPSTPLYSDFRSESALSSEEVRARAADALQETGWTLDDEPVSEEVVATEPRTLSQWGLYSVRAYLEVLPLDGPHVRVLVHPYRAYVTGAESKIMYLPGGVRRAVLPDLRAALEERGLEPLGTPRERDRAARKR